MHYYQFHPADYMLSTAHLDLEHDLAYRRLLDHYYSTEEPIPLETQVVSRRLRLGYDVVIEVLKEFFQETENGWIQDRCQREIAAYQAKAEVAKRNGSLGGRPKKTQRVSDRNPEETGSKPDHKLTKNHKPRTINHKPYTESEEFSQFWTAYPRKEAKAKALEAWNKNTPPIEEVLAALKWQTKKDDWTKEGGKYIPMPATYLNARRWTDERPKPKTTQPQILSVMNNKINPGGCL